MSAISASLRAVQATAFLDPRDVRDKQQLVFPLKACCNGIGRKLPSLIAH